MRCYLPLLLVGLLIPGCAENPGPVAQGKKQQASEVKTKQAVSGTNFDDWIIGEPVRHENLTIFPISSREPKNEDRFLTLDEGLRSGLVEIVEMGPADAPNGSPIDQNANPTDEILPDDVEPAPATPDPFGEALPADPQEAPADADPFGMVPSESTLVVATHAPTVEEPVVTVSEAVAPCIQVLTIPVEQNQGVSPLDYVSCGGYVPDAGAQTTLVAQIDTDQSEEANQESEKQAEETPAREVEDSDGSFLEEVSKRNRINLAGPGIELSAGEIAEGTPPEPEDDLQQIPADLEIPSDIDHEPNPDSGYEENDSIQDRFGDISAPEHRADPFEELQTGGSAEVNRLLVWNKSDRPLFLMPGEVISGGRQDRTIGSELVLQPSDKPVPIDAFCVESGRWSNRSVEDTTELLVVAQSYGGSVAAVERTASENPAGEQPGTEADGDASEGTELVATLDQENPPVSAIRIEDSARLSLVVSQTQDIRDRDELLAAASEANAGKFVGSVGMANKTVRMAVQVPVDQGSVWDAVGKVNAKTGNAISSGNFSGNYGNEEIAARLKPYLDACLEEVSKRPQVIGVVVAIDGKIETADLFESTPLFLKLWPKLLKSYALDASIAGVEDSEEMLADRQSPLSYVVGNNASNEERQIEAQPQADPFGVVSPSVANDELEEGTPPEPVIEVEEQAAVVEAEEPIVEDQPKQRVVKQCGVDDCLAFLQQLKAAQAGEVELEGGLVQSKHEGENVVIFSVADPRQASSHLDGVSASGWVDAEVAPAERVREGGLGGSVHTGAFSK